MSRNLVYYVCFLKIVACAIFLKGFFPFKPAVSSFSNISDLPSSVGDNKLASNQLYHSHYSKVVLMVIDAFRYDFVSNGNGMPFLKELLNDGRSCLLSAKAAVPTVTLPRVKAIVTGTVPGFLDVIFNFGSSVMTDDNIIHQASQHGYNVVFYGDDTWLRLFPNVFNRFEGTSSFFVNDFYEVDSNVTRNLKKELQRSDWDMMILHYLGLDHIGHVEGPYGPSVPSKLEEMDNVIREIYIYFRKLKEVDGSDGLLVLTGDHGMKNSGGHGGSSYEEVIVPVVFLNSVCSTESRKHVIQQGDLASILSVLLGIPIPAGSSGRISPNWLGDLHLNESLYATYYNAWRMKNYMLPTISNEIEDEFNKGVHHYSSWIAENHTEDWNQASQSFSTVQEKIASVLEHSNETNFLSLLSSIILLLQALTLLFTENSEASNDGILPKLVASCVMASCLVLWLYELHSLIAALLVLYNVPVLVKSNFVIETVLSADYFICSLIILHPLSFLSTSFIEEEHQYWYFTFATLLLYAMYKDCRSVEALFPLLLFQRFLKTLNQTGDKWANLPDLGDWLSLPENNFYMTSFYFMGLTLSMFTNWICRWQNHSNFSIDSIFILMQGISTLLYNIAIGRISVNYDYPKSSGVREVNLFWILTGIRTFISLYQLITARMRSKSGSKSIPILSILIQLHLSIVSLLMKPHNVIFGPSMVLFSLALRSKVKHQWQLEVFHYWMGMTFFFYMGNSNSIASIDVTVGFIGLETFNLFLAGLFVILHTYAFPILTYLLLTRELIKRKTISDQKTSSSGYSVTYLLLNGIPLVVFMILILIQREHLFIWTVFSPKLLYLMCQTVLITILTVSSGIFHPYREVGIQVA